MKQPRRIALIAAVVASFFLAIEYDFFGLTDRFSSLRISNHWLLSSGCKKIRKEQKLKPSLTAFAVGKYGICGGAWGQPSLAAAKAQALKSCEFSGGKDCKIWDAQ